MGHLGQDMDIFWDIFSDGAAGQAWVEKDKDEDKLGTGDQPDTTDRDENTDTWTDSAKEDPKWTEISKDVLDKDNKDDVIVDDAGGEGDKKPDLKEWETDQVLDDLVKDLEDNIDKVDDGDADAKQVLQNTLSDLQKANLRIKELEEEWKTFQDKYFEKFGENSELNLMKPLIQTVQDDPELFLLVKSYKTSDSDSKVNSLVAMLEKETGMNVSSYLTDNGKGAMSSATSTGSDSGMMKPVNKEFTPDKVQSTDSEDLF